MAEWAVVENNEVIEVYDILPKNWRGISGLRLSVDNIQFLNSIGWFKVIKQHEEFDSNIFQIEKYEYFFENNSVVEKLKLAEKEYVIPSENDLQINKSIILKEIRNIRNDLLQKSDWTQILDVQRVLSEEDKLNVSIYRQKLRDMPNEYMNKEIYDYNDVVWPDTPYILVKGL